MKQLLLILLFFTCSSSCQKNNKQEMNLPSTAPAGQVINMSSQQFTYLALGDSYTIGQGVAVEKNYPNQTTAILEKDSLKASAKIIATTGWTTTQLKAGVKEASDAGKLLREYDIVTLLIGVNNEYQGQPPGEYKPEFEGLLTQAIALAGGRAARVIVISIPDWSVTPFASGRDRQQIAKEIDEYNVINKNLSELYSTHYLDITESTRQAAGDLSLLAPDGLHPSGIEYARWAERLAPLFKKILAGN